MKAGVPRRAVLVLGLMALAPCGRPEPYFGASTPPATQTLIYELGGEPSSFDPATALGFAYGDVRPALLEPLLSRHPDILEPAASLATHYEIDASLAEISVFLRGHPSLVGTQLAGPKECWGAVERRPAGDRGGLINERKARPETLAVLAQDAFTLRVEPSKATSLG